jgi:hypothetical protein
MHTYNIENQTLERDFSELLSTQFDGDFEKAIQHFISILGGNNEEQKNIYEKLRRKILQTEPDLRVKSPKEMQADFETLSKKIRENMPYETVEEFMKMMGRKKIYEDTVRH